MQVPWSICFLLTFLADQLSGGGRVVEIKPVGRDLGEAFRSDAKAEGNVVVVGGWECLGGRRPGQARWYSVELTRANAPWAFARGEPFRSIAALELFGTLLSVMAFSDGWPASAAGMIKLKGTTDNQGNTWILNRLMCSKFPMLLVLGELAVQLREKDLQLQLEWAPRLQNEEADALTNGDFSAFRAENRITMDPDKLPFKVLPDLVRVAGAIHEDICERRAGRRGAAADGKNDKGKKRKLRERDPWG